MNKTEKILLLLEKENMLVEKETLVEAIKEIDGVIVSLKNTLKNKMIQCVKDEDFETLHILKEEFGELLSMNDDFLNFETNAKVVNDNDEENNKNNEWRENNGLVINGKVRHKEYGNGEIIDISSDGFYVEFWDNSVKRFSKRDFRKVFESEY